MKKICQTGACDYLKYYQDQAGHGLPEHIVYRGKAFQRGRGLFSSLTKRYAIPALKYIGRSAFGLGKSILRDVLDGHDVKQASKNNLKKTVGNTLKRAAEKVEQSGGGMKKRRKTAPPKRKPVKKKPAKKAVSKASVSKLKKVNKRKKTTKAKSTKKKQKKIKISKKCSDIFN